MGRRPKGPQAAGPVRLAGFYLLFFATLGITLPFLPAWFKSIGLSGGQIGLLLALQPALTLVAPPLWGWLADRTGRADRVLSVIAFGAAVAFAPLVYLRTFETLLLAMAAYAVFASSITTILDSIALHRVALVGGSYARIRMFGSMGFVLSSAVFGFAITEVDRNVVLVPLLLIVAYACWSLLLSARSTASASRSVLAGWGLLRHRDLLIMLVASALHWIACAPFHATFGIHVLAIGLSPWVIGAAAGVGVLAEVAVMFFYPRLAERLAPRHVLFVAFVASALRWFGMAVVTSGWAIILLSVLHGLTFGAFLVAAVGYVTRRVPDAMRAAGQALLVSVTFGVGGLLGYLAAGSAYEWLGGHRLFAVAGVLELLPALLILTVGAPTVTRVAIERGAEASPSA
jgi:MFS transporter, PPP family, 3-phenylpropionic acid transporter